VQILRHKTIGSTNAEALALAEKDCPEWTVVLADEQTSGRGRSGKYWHSPPGGLWFSVVLRPNIPSESLPLIQFYAANSTRRVLELSVGRPVGVKWPNDLILGGLKLGGILVEAKLVGTRIDFAVVGTGINLNVEPSSLPKSATSTFKATGRTLSRDIMLEALLEELQSSYDDLNDKEKIFREWWEHCMHRFRPVTVARPEGAISGVSTGIGPDGQLLVKTSTRDVLEIPEGTILST
jgi:BirA family biotin operon repressor/biotin-[acetyl-CoA-carboxylase] ligase